MKKDGPKVNTLKAVFYRYFRLFYLRQPSETVIAAPPYARGVMEA